jgi:hypothetical protein
LTTAAEKILSDVRDFAPSLTARAAEIETARRLPPALVKELETLGLFRMLVPQSHGGLEISFPPSIDILAALAAADGATGWTVMIGCETPQLFSLLPRPSFDRVYAQGHDVVCGGAFDGLEKIIRQRTAKTGIGFGAEVLSPDDRKDLSRLLRETEPEDLIKFGLIPEFVGRLPVVATLEELDDAALIQILVEPKNALIKQYHKMFRMEGVELEVREPALRAIASKALARKTGARGLRSILEQVLLDVMYDLPSQTNLSRVVVDEATIANDGKPLLMFAESPKVAAAHS